MVPWFCPSDNLFDSKDSTALEESGSSRGILSDDTNDPKSAFKVTLVWVLTPSLDTWAPITQFVPTCVIGVLPYSAP